MFSENLASLTPLSRRFYNRSPATVAAQLIGKAILARANDRLLGGLIVETEAYLSEQDPASHSSRGLTARNQSMFAQPGTLYVYSIHAKYCLNAVTEPEGVGSAVLIRAIEPLWGLSEMTARRGQQALRKLCRGPAMLCQALAIDKQHDGIDLCQRETIWISNLKTLPKFSITRSPRIGIRHAAELPLRFFVDGNQFVSGKAGLHTQPNCQRFLPE